MWQQRALTALALTCLLSQQLAHAAPTPLVNTSIGMINGTQELNNTVYSYLGLPYAYAPIGSRRYAYAELLDTYSNETIEATTYPLPCIQYTGNTTAVVGVLDCLKLNVWTPIGEKPVS